MNTWGEHIRLSIFGESHGAAVGIVIDGLPGGFELDLEEIGREMDRRAPGRDRLSTARTEADRVEIVSGFFQGRTTGTPLTGIIHNTNTRSKDYTPELIRPGHADYTGFMRYGGAHDYRGGGHFSGRITAPLVFAGAVAKQLLKARGITVGAHIQKIGHIEDLSLDVTELEPEHLRLVSGKRFPVIDDAVGEQMQAYILETKNKLDSAGGVVECAILGMPPGAGAPFFGSVESRLSSMLFSVPAVKGVEFGAGFRFAELTGSAANDEFYLQDGTVKTYTNNNAGINGGITNGMPVVFRTALKPTPSIAKKQRTVDLRRMENTELEIHGRHDPCIVHRAVPVIEAAAALTAYDLVAELDPGRGYDEDTCGKESRADE